MNYSELELQKEKTLKELQYKRDSLKDYNDASQRIIEDINTRQKELRTELFKRIKRHFKGIEPYITISDTELVVGVNEVANITYRYGEFYFNNVSSKLANTIKQQYEDVYGEPKEMHNVYAKIGDITEVDGIVGKVVKSSIPQRDIHMIKPQK